MNADDPIRIEAVTNGFIVCRLPPTGAIGSVQQRDDYVFQTMMELVFFIEGHFSHRNHDIDADPDEAELMRRYGAEGK